MARECPYLCKPQCCIYEDIKTCRKSAKFEVVKLATLFKFKQEQTVKAIQYIIPNSAALL